MNAERDHSLAAHLRKISYEAERMAELLDPPDSAEPRKPTDEEVLHHIHTSKPETPEPAELGELLDAYLRASHGDVSVGGMEWSRKALAVAREAIVAFVARQTDAFRAETVRLLDRIGMVNREHSALQAESEGLKATITLNAIFADERSAENDAERARVRTLNEENEELTKSFAASQGVILASQGVIRDKQRIIDTLRGRAANPEPCRECEAWREHKLAYGRLANWIDANHPEVELGVPWADTAIRLIQGADEAAKPDDADEPDPREFFRNLKGVLFPHPETGEPVDIFDGESHKLFGAVREERDDGFVVRMPGKDFVFTKTPERKPGDMWCAVNMSPAPRPDDEACDAKRGNVLPGQKPGGVQMKVWKCRDCEELRTEPAEATEPEPASGKPFLVTYPVQIYAYHEDGQFVADVPRLPECNSYSPLSADDALANAKEALKSCLKSYLAAGDIPWLPLAETPLCPPGATERVVEVKIKVDTATENETPDTGAEPAEDEDRESFVDAICSLAAAVDGKAEELPPLSEWMKTVIDKVRHSNGVVTVDVRDLVKAIRQLEANQRPEPTVETLAGEWRCQRTGDVIALNDKSCPKRSVLADHITSCGGCRTRVWHPKGAKVAVEQDQPLGTSIQAAIAALPVTLRADATDMAEVATAAGEPVLGCRLLVSMQAELIDREATCGECENFITCHTLDLSQQRQMNCAMGRRDVCEDSLACVKIQRKPPESSEETGSLAEEIRLTGLAIKRTAAKKKAESESEPVGKARFFRHELALWCYIAEQGWHFSLVHRTIMTSSQSIEYTRSLSGVSPVTRNKAIAILAKAGWPEGLAKLQEVIGGAECSTQ